MPAKDMPQKALEEYMGSTPCPEDFDSFWDRAIEEAWNFPLRYEISVGEIPDTETVHYREIWMDGMGGARLHIKYIYPTRSPLKTEAGMPVVLQFHGYPGSSRGWFELSTFAGLGMGMLAMECPSQGGYSIDGCLRQGTLAGDHIIMGLDGPAEQMYYVQVFQDTCLMVRLARELEGLDPDRIYVNGASQGAGLGLVCASLNAPYIRKCAALYPFLSDYKRAWDMDRDLVVYDGPRYYTRWFDPEGKRTEKIFCKLGYIDVQNFVKRITCPVLFGTGLQDVCCPPSSQFAVYHRIEGPKRHLIFPEYGHEEIGAFDDRIIGFFLCEDVKICLEQI